MASSQQYGWVESDMGVVLQTAVEVEEGELSDNVPSSEEDVSPRSLVIDAQDNEEQMGKESSGVGRSIMPCQRDVFHEDGGVCKSHWRSGLCK